MIKICHKISKSIHKTKTQLIRTIIQNAHSNSRRYAQQESFHDILCRPILISLNVENEFSKLRGHDAPTRDIST